MLLKLIQNLSKYFSGLQKFKSDFTVSENSELNVVDNLNIINI